MQTKISELEEAIRDVRLDQDFPRGEPALRDCIEGTIIAMDRHRINLDQGQGFYVLFQIRLSILEINF